MKFEGFVGGAYLGVSKIISAERAINIFLERAGTPGAQSSESLLGTPGLKVFSQVATGGIRGLWSGDNRLFSVSDDILYEIDSNGHPLPQGNVGAAATPARIFSNGNQLFIVSGSQGYLADGNAVNPVVPAVAGAYLDGYFIALTPNSNKIRVSGLLDGASWDPLDVAMKEGSPDRLQMIFTDHEILLLLGEKTTEFWQPNESAGATGFPFIRIPGQLIETGIWAPFSIALSGGRVCWLAGDDRGVGVVVRTNGFTPERISNHAIEQQIQSYPNSFNAVGSSWQYNGHEFYELHFPEAGKTWLFDNTTNLWTERAWWDTLHGAGQWREHWARYHAFTFGKHFVGDWRSGIIHEQNSAFLDDSGTAIRRLRSAPHLNSEKKDIFFHNLTVEMEVGTAGQGVDPQMMMRMSNDGGFTWGNEHWKSAGRVGEYKKRVIWRALGYARDRVYEISTTDPFPYAIVDAYQDLTLGL